MSRRKIIGIMSLVLLCIIASASDPEEMESRLNNVSGEKKIPILLELTRCYHERDPQKSLEYGGETRELLRDFPNPTALATLLNQLCLAYTNLGDYEKARQCVQKAQKLAQKTNDQKVTADALVSLAYLLNRESSYDLSIEQLFHAKVIYEKLKDTEGMADVFFNLGLSYYKTSDYTAALEYSLNALKIYEIIDNKDRIADSFNNIGRIYGEIEDLPNALDYFNKYLDMGEKIRYKKGTGRALHNIAFIYKKQGKLSEAMSYARQALKIKEELGNPREIALTLALIGSLHKDRNDYVLALKYFERSLYISKNFNDREFIAGNLCYIGMIKMELGNHTEALSILRQSRELAAEIGALDDERDAVKALSDTYADMKNFEKALEYYREYNKLDDAIFNDKSRKRVSQLQARFDLEKKEHELLKKSDRIRELDLARQRYFVKSLIIISLLVIIAALLIFARYRLKVRAHRLLEQEICEHKKTTRELLRSQKMEALGILAGGIAHDFNNLLGVIMGFLTMIKENVQKDKTTLQMVESVEDASRQAAKLSDKFLTLSRGRWIVTQKVYFEDILKSTAEHHSDIQHLLGNVSIAPDLYPLNGDERQLREVLFNILKNADEATSEPKKVKIVVENITLDSENDLSLKEGNYIKISISDNGKGIPWEQLDRIFDPYFSTKDTPYQKGMGLGLAVCYAIIKQHCGYISLESQVGKGTTVELHIPAYE